MRQQPLRSDAGPPRRLGVVLKHVHQRTSGRPAGSRRDPAGGYGSDMPPASSASAKRLTLIACILGSGIVLLDGTVVTVALPSIQRSLGGGLAAQQWVANGYLLTLGSLILVGGSLGDLYGERNGFAIGVGAFGVASAICAVAPSIGVLVAARALPGARGARHGDAGGGLLGGLGLAGPVFALIEQPRLGWSSPAVYGPVIAGVALLAIFILYESRTSDPMLPLRLFRRRNFWAGNVETFSMYAGLAILFFFLILFMQQIGGYSPLHSRLATLPVTGVLFLASRRLRALADR